jgi:LEA14-like dessication related protein
LSKTYEIKLTFEEMKLIDGQVSEKAQDIIDRVKKENSFGFSLPVMNEVLRKAEEIGKLTWSYKSIRSCSHCDKQYDYARYPRSGKNHRKGDKNFNKPLYYSGIKFNEGFVTIQGLGDMCSDCCKKHNVINQLIDYILDNDLKIEIQKNKYRDSKYLKDDIRICYDCDYEMTESEMTTSPTVMGDGRYPSGCPKCGAESRLFGKNHKTTNKFKHRLNPMITEEVQQIKQLVRQYNSTIEDKEQQISFSVNRNKENIYYVKENKWNNGNRLVIKFDIKQKIYYLGYFWKDKVDQFVNVLDGYEETDREYFDL